MTTPLTYSELGSRWVAAERCRQGLNAAADLLARRGIRLMTIKGMHLAFAVASNNPWFRPLADADALPEPGRYDEAIAILSADRRWHTDPGRFACVLSFPSGARVDIHRAIVPPFFADFDDGGLWRRARRGLSIGPHIWVPDSLDAMAIAIAHHMKDLVGSVGHGQLDVDLQVLMTESVISPKELADRLREHGLRFAGVIALGALSEQKEKWRVWTEALRPTPRERRWGQLLQSTMRVAANHWNDAGLILPALAADTIVRAGLGISVGVLRWARILIVRRRGRTAAARHG